MNLVQRSVLVVAAIWICRLAEALVTPGRSQEPVPLPAFGLVVLIMLASVLLLGGSGTALVPQRQRTAVRWLKVVMAVGLTAMMVPAVVLGLRTGALPTVHGWTLVAGNVALGAGLVASFLVAGSHSATPVVGGVRWQSAVRLLAAFFGITAGLRAWRGLQICAPGGAACPAFLVPAIVCALLIALAWLVRPAAAPVR